MVRCDRCKKGRPKLFNKDGKFCNEKCYNEWKGEEVADWVYGDSDAKRRKFKGNYR